MNNNLEIFWTFCFGLMVAISLLGNSIVIWIVCAHRRMWSITNYFVLNLSLADILLAGLNCSFSFLYMRDRPVVRDHHHGYYGHHFREWKFGGAYCSINQFISVCSLAASVLTMMAITLERRRAVISPLSPRTSKKVLIVSLLIIWILCALIALPPAYFSTTSNIHKTQILSSGDVCIVLWPDGPQGFSKLDFYYNLLYFTLTYALPLLVMLLCYVQMGRVLWGHQAIGEENISTRKSRKTKQKIVKMFGLMAVVFAVCWLPYHSYFLYSYHNPNIMRAWYTPHMYLAFYWLAMSTCCVNPLVYYAMNKRYREYFQQVLCCTRVSHRRAFTGSQVTLRTQNVSSSHWRNEVLRQSFHKASDVSVNNRIIHQTYVETQFS